MTGLNPLVPPNNLVRFVGHWVMIFHRPVGVSGAPSKGTGPNLNILEPLMPRVR